MLERGFARFLSGWLIRDRWLVPRQGKIGLFPVEIPSAQALLCCRPPADGLLEDATAAIIKAAKTGKIGDGKVFVYSIEDAIRIRTEETGERAV